MLNGLLNIDKPQGMTSHDVVDAVRRATGMRAVGHTGTLDPETSGVLLLCLGQATKFTRYFEALEKTYWTVLQMGVCTDTQDATGRVLRRCLVPSLSAEQLQRILPRYTGLIQQIPPMYSAVKHHGQRLYRLARQGQTVRRQARDVYIKRLELLDVRDTRVTLVVVCSKGTYIRTLGEEIGLALGYGAYMACLQRCQIGPFTLRQAFALDEIRQQAHAGTLSQCIVPLAHALEFLPALSVTRQQYHDLQRHHHAAMRGLLETHWGALDASTCYRLCIPPGKTVAVLQRHPSIADKWKIRAFTDYV